MGSKNPQATKRIMSEWRELRNEMGSEFYAAPLDDNLFEWHFTLRGPAESDFARGLYHGRIMLPTDYPFRPPDVQFLTPNGRWETDTMVRRG